MNDRGNNIRAHISDVKKQFTMHKIFNFYMENPRIPASKVKFNQTFKVSHAKIVTSIIFNIYWKTATNLILISCTML